MSTGFPNSQQPPAQPAQQYGYGNPPQQTPPPQQPVGQPPESANQPPPAPPAGEYTPAGGAPAEPPPQYTPPSAQQAAEEASFRDGLKELLPSLNLDEYPEDEQLLAHLAQGYQAGSALDQLRPYVQLGQAVAPHWDSFQEWQQSQAQQPQAPQDPASLESFFGNPPEFDTAWYSQITYDDNGNPIPRPGARPDIISKIREYNDWRESAVDKLLKNPHEFFEHYWKPRFSEFQQNIEFERQTRAQREQQQVIQSWIDSNSGWLYQHNNGQRMVNPQNGQPQWSPAGLLCAKKYQELVTQGLTDPQTALEAAKAMTVGSQPQQPFQPPSQPPMQPNQPPQSPQEAFLQPPVGQPGTPGHHDRSGSVPTQSGFPNQPPQNPYLDFGEALRENARRQGII